MPPPTYIKSLLRPNGQKPTGRKVWSIDLETIWLPFFTATNTDGLTVIPQEALGAPLRLGYNADGTVKLSEGVPPKYVMLVGGWLDAQTMDGYVRAMEAEEALQAMQR